MVLRLHCDSYGDGDNTAPPLVLLHGFGGLAANWEPIAEALSDNRRVLAFDLPGHGLSLSYPEAGHPRVAAAAVIGELDERRITKAHLCGHSMGGAIACVVALERPDLVASLTLLAPGGFGEEINAPLLRRFAAADDRDTLEPLLEQFYGWDNPVPDEELVRILADRQRPGATAKLVQIAGIITEGGSQGLLPKQALAARGIPIKVIWGTRDRVVPTRQAHKLPGEIATHVFEGVGHMPHEEVPEAVVRLIRENVGVTIQ